MKIFFIALAWILGVFPLASFAEGKPQVSAKDFSQMQAILCDAQTLDLLKSINKPCAAENFDFQSVDLNGDGQTEWLAFGPSGECGAHGNCPFYIFRKEGEKWAPLSQKDCDSDGCWANSFATEVLSTRHNGYRDLNIAGDSGSFFWTKDVYEWNGSEYRLKPNSTTYFLADSEAKLQKVSKAQWENCSKNGKDCP